MNPSVNMNSIRAAMMARMGQGVPTPASAQMSGPGGLLPGGGQNTPTLQPPQVPAAGPAPTPQATMPAGAPNAQGTQAQMLAKVAGGAQNPGLDPETRAIAKALTKKLLDVI